MALLRMTVSRLAVTAFSVSQQLKWVWNVMALAQKPDFVSRRKGRVHLTLNLLTTTIVALPSNASKWQMGFNSAFKGLNRRESQFIRLLAAYVCASAVVILDKPCSVVVWRVLATHSVRQFPFTSPPVRHGVPSDFKRTLPCRLWHFQRLTC